MKLWTIDNDYSATGEGRTIQALITYAENEEEAIKKFATVFDEFWAQGAQAKEGIIENELTQYLFTPAMFESVKNIEGRANVVLHAQFHFNFS